MNTRSPSPTDADLDANSTGPERAGAGWLRVVVPAALCAIFAFAITWHFVQPAPPKHVIIATGPRAGAYFAMAQKYVDYFRANGVTLEVHETGGSVDNFALLNQKDSGVDVALVQAGASPAASDRPGIEAVAAIYLEPVLLFYRGDATLARLPQLAGKRIAVGANGSGVRVMADLLLDEAGVAGGATRVEIGGDAAADALSAGQVDAAFYVIAPDAPVVARLLATPGVRLMSFDHARAYGRRHPFLSPTTLYRGSVDVRQNLPADDVELIAAPTTIAVRGATHSAIVQLLVRAAQEVNRGATLLSDPGTFPNAVGSELPFNHDARYFLANAPSILHRTLPFWLASMIDRLIILVLPLLVVLIPLIRLTPAAMNWRIQRKLLARYKRVRQLDQRLSATSSAEGLRAGVAELSAMEVELSRIKLPTSKSKDLYDLRNSIAYVRGMLEQWLKPAAVATTTAT